MKKVTIKATATVYMEKEIEMPDEEADVFMSGTADDILCNIGFDDIVDMDAYELEDITFK